MQTKWHLLEGIGYLAWCKVWLPLVLIWFVLLILFFRKRKKK